MSDYDSSEETSFRDLYERDSDNRFNRTDSLIQKEQKEILNDIKASNNEQIAISNN